MTIDAQKRADYIAELKRVTPEKIEDFNEDDYVYVYCKCPLPSNYAIKFKRIKDDKPHLYSGVCDKCGTEVSVYSKSYEDVE